MVTIRHATLTVHGGPRDGLAILLGERPITMGRRPDNDVVIDDATVSRRHAMIMSTAYGYVLRDLSSANGTYVNDRKIASMGHLLSSHAIIRLAGSEVTLFFRQEAVSTVVLETDSPAPWTASPA